MTWMTTLYDPFPSRYGSFNFTIFAGTTSARIHLDREGLQCSVFEGANIEQPSSRTSKDCSRLRTFLICPKSTGMWFLSRWRYHVTIICRWPGHHVEGGSLAELFVARSATRWLRL